MRDRAAALLARGRGDRGAASLEVALVTGFASCVAAALFAFMQASIGTWLEGTVPPGCESPESAAAIVECFDPDVAALVDGEKVADSFRISLDQ